MATHKLNPERWATKFLKQMAMNGFRLTPRDLSSTEQSWTHYSGTVTKGYWVQCGSIRKYGIMYIEHGSHATFWIGNGPLEMQGVRPGEKQWSHDMRVSESAPTPLDLLLGDTHEK